MLVVMVGYSGRVFPNTCNMTLTTRKHHHRWCLSGDDVKLVGNHSFTIEFALVYALVYQWSEPSFRHEPGTLGTFEILQTLSDTFEIFEKLLGTFEILQKFVGIFEIFQTLSVIFEINKIVLGIFEIE